MSIKKKIPKSDIFSMDFSDVWSLITTLFSRPVELSSLTGKSTFTAWVDGDAMFVKLSPSGSVRVITKKVFEKCWKISLEMASKGEDPFQPAWFYKTTNGTYIARVFKYVIEGV
ncbi:MAG: hypothetical protein N3F04_05375 [Candidatus Nezhaarchaeota archaeon]|nr:hypothetical protein [Candidatus Nezhaarchaeota archaeon]MCX8142173.1 hypothetical protein [Candidatus Nezhaarchaeota archaeon]MDW8050044.1 hypothetical protein [Nitrososphaerota archaeon]